ncbi:hypothetical protein MCHI_001755 [Candidatus Magnetoovum chiemensis]|nr:hypothetical protein MCHI_001755 [Candidatus Magnetoovum chiemensis]
MAGFLIYTGHEIGGAIFGTAWLASLVSIFVLGKKAQTTERARR